MSHNYARNYARNYEGFNASRIADAGLTVTQQSRHPGFIRPLSK